MSGLRGRPGSATILDVAQLAGVSIKTVSRVMNRERHVSIETRARVDRAMRMLDYRPNVAARSLPGGRAYLVGLYYDNPSPGYVARMQAGALRACGAAGYHLVIEELASGRADLRDQVRRSAAAVRMDGVVLSPPLCDRADVLDLLEGLGLTYVRIAPSCDLSRGPYVCMDDMAAAREMARHLVGLGHRRIGFVEGPPEHAVSAVRRAGLAAGLAEAGLALSAACVAAGDFTFRSGWEASEQLLARGERPTAIFACNDDMALGVVAMAHRMGLHIPEDLSIAGFDDSPGAEVIWPQLTTVRQPVAEMTAGAVNRLIEGAGAADGPQLFDFELVVRGSTAPPRDRT